MSLLGFCVKNILGTQMLGLNQNKVSFDRSEFKVEIEAQCREGKEK